ncbi:MAG: hypothetical protein K6G45_00815, partial [Lachnospiraceae bacterium]|nr:hypothetical protein [Lachnospiraceae bacterium]
MKNFWKRFIAALLCTVMIVTLLPNDMFGRTAASAASLLENSPEYNQEILDALSGIAGSEAGAEEYYRMLQQYGLIDDEGNIIENWDIELDGRKVDIDEIKEILAGEYDPNKCVWVDGTPVYLSNLKTMIEIEDYLAYIKETYFSDKVWTEEQQVNCLDLLEQLKTEGIELISTAADPISGTIVGPRGISHEARVTVTPATDAMAQDVGAAFNATFNVNLTGAANGQVVTFKYRALSASRTVADSGVEKTVTLTAGADGKATGSFTVEVYRVTGLIKNDDTDKDTASTLYSTETYFYVNCHSITNALFTKKDQSNNDIDCDNLGIEVKCKGSTNDMPEYINFDISGNTGIPEKAMFHSNIATVLVDDGTGTGGSISRYIQNEKPSVRAGTTYNLDAVQQQLVYWGLVDELNFVHLVMPPDQNATGDNYISFYRPERDLSKLGGYNFENYSVFDSVMTIGTSSVPVCIIRNYSLQSNAGGSPIHEREIDFGTWEFIVKMDDDNDQNGTGYTNWYNYSRGFIPNEDYTHWSASNLLPNGVTDISSNSSAVNPSLGAGTTIKSLKFEGGYSLYPIRIVSLQESPDIIYRVFTIENRYRLSDYYTDFHFQEGHLAPGGRTVAFYDGYEIFNKNVNALFYENGYKKTDLYPWSGAPLDIKLEFRRSIDPTVTSIAVPAGNYYPGEVIPVVVKYSEPVKAGTVLKINNVEYTPREQSASNIQTFLYTVTEAGDQSLIVNSITVENLDGNAVDCSTFLDTASAGSTYTVKAEGVPFDTEIPADHPEVKGFTIHPEIKRTAFTGMTATIDDSAITAPVMSVEVSISNDSALTAWLANMTEQFELDGTTYISKYLRVRVASDDRAYISDFLKLKVNGESLTGGKLVLLEDLALPVNDSGSYRNYIAELYLANSTFDSTATITDSMFDPVIGKADNKNIGIAYDGMDGIVLVAASDVTSAVEVLKQDGSVYLNAEGNSSPIYLDEGPVIRASFVLSSAKTYAYGDINKITTYDQNGNLVDPNADFVWKSSDPTVAAISSQGVVTPTGRDGSVYFTLTALNGSFADVSVNTGTIVIVSGSTPLFNVPDIAYTIVDGKDITIHWTSNLCENNGNTLTVFTASLYRGNYADLTAAEASGARIYSTTVSGTASDPVSSASIPAEYLTYSYDNADNVFSIFISATYKDETFSGKARVEVEPKPAKVRLESLSNYYILDTAGSVNIRWKVENFARFLSENPANNADMFEVLITKNDGQVIQRINNPGTAGEEGSYTGSYTLGNLAFTASSDKNGYRQTYIVSIKAKNGSASTWSYDSFILYVYDADALKIWIQPTSDTDKDGKVTGTVIGGSGSFDPSLTMKNSAIASMTQDQILALKRDISLQNVISANYGEYAWTELSDQLEWASSKNNIATINYRQGTLYEDIRGMSFTTYRPATDFLVSGLRDGQTTITVKHALTGMTDTLNVTVETLKDKLYLFQCYPQKETTLTYRNGNGEEKTITSNSKGAAAIYEESGISSDIYFKSGTGNEVYLGTYYNSDLKSGEGDSTKLELYPCNNLSLRHAAYAYLYVKKPDGTPYTGSVMFRGGVYINDVYYRDIKFALNGTSAATLYGDEDQISSALGESGKLEITMDHTQMVQVLGRELSAKDKITYSFLISGSDGRTESSTYYPMYVFIDANASEDTFISTGEAVITFRANKRPGEIHPFIVEQYVTLTDSKGKSLRKTSVRDSSESTGISQSYPKAEMETLVMWWGENTGSNNDYRLQLFTADGYKIASKAGQSEQSVTKYPFSKYPLTSYTLRMDKDSLSDSVKNGQKKALYLEYYREAGKMSRKEDLPFKITNIIDFVKTEDDRDLKDKLKNIGTFINTDGSGARNGQDHGDDFVAGALKLLAAVSFTDSDDLWVTLNITPTTDPTKFMALMKFNFSNMDEHEASQNGVEIIGMDSSQDFGYVPNVEDLPYGGARKWANEARDQIIDAKEEMTGSDMEIGYAVGGYMESLIYWDFNEEKWAMQVVDGGFNVGGGIEMSWSWNVMVGPVPLTTEIKVGGQVRINMDAITTAYQNNTTKKVETATEYLTKLRIYLYVSVFAGVGIDYSVVALKLGIFGQLNLEMTFEWLNRPYLTEHRGDNITMLATPDGRDSGTSQANLNGQNFVLDGLLGIKFVATVACIEYEKVLFSVGFDLLNESTGDYDKIERLWANNQANLREAIDALVSGGSAQLMNIDGHQYLALDLAARMESRDYLNDPANPRQWNPERKNNEVMSLAANVTDADRITTLATNIYPYSNPKMTVGGYDIIFLSDMNNPGANATRIAKAHELWNSSTQTSYYEDQGEVYSDTDSGITSYGDSNFDVASYGDSSYGSDFTVTAWTRRMQDNGRSAGQTVDNADQLISFNGMEVFAAVERRGESPVYVRLTDNSTPDLAPSVAINENKALVAWRSVAVAEEGESGNFNIADFNKKDNILFKLYDEGTNTWSSALTLYNGSSGNVKAIETAMADDGTSAVVYTLDTDGDDATTNDREIVYAVIDTDGNVLRTVRVTNDENLDENPQLTVVRFKKNEEQSFVLGWYSQSGAERNLTGASTTTGKTEGADIKMLDFDKNGNIGGRLPGSLSQVAGGSDIKVTSSFKFAEYADLIDTLSVTWVERAKAEAKDLSSNSGNGIISTATVNSESEHDVLKAVKFYTYGQDNDMIGLTGAINVAEMPDGTLIDYYDIHQVSSEYRHVYDLNAVIVGTTYGSNGVVTRTVEDTAGNTVTISLPSEVTNLYTVNETYENTFSVPSIYYDRQSIRHGSATMIRFGIRNDGVLPISKLIFDINGEETVYGNLNVLPGDSISLGADYSIPENEITNPLCDITAVYDISALRDYLGDVVYFNQCGNDPDSANLKYTYHHGVIALDNPDLEMTDARIVEEENGKRMIQMKLNNALDAPLSGTGRKVGISFYSDVTMQNEIPEAYLAPIIIDSNADLKMIDEGGYSIQTEFDIAGFVQYQKTQPQLQGQQNISDEIPDTGITVYISAHILRDGQNTGEYYSEAEPNIRNNTAQV